MKQRFILSVIMAMLCLPVLAYENYFRPGTVWTIERTDPGATPFPKNTYKEFIGDEIEVGGEQVLPFYYENDKRKELLYYLRTEGDKVYWRNIEPEYPEWHLMYDFGLKEGESSIITGVRSDALHLEEYKFTCLRTDMYLPEEDGLWMEMDQCRLGHEETSEGNPKLWCMGIGCFDPLHNVFSGDTGIFLRLIEVTSNGKVVYSDDTNSVSSIRSNEVCVIASGSNITLSGVLVGSQVNIYDIEGKPVNSFRASADVENVRIESSGIYFVHINKETYKVLAY